MSVSLPPGSAWFWFEFHCAGDDEAMFSNLGVTNEGSLFVDLADVQSAFDNCQAEFTAVVSTDYTCGPGYVLVGTDTDPFRFEGSGVAAGSQGTPCPPNVSVLSKKQSALAGRRGRGRNYIPGIAEADVDAAGYIGEGPIADWVLIWNNIATFINDIPVGAGGLAEPAIIHGLLRDPDTGDPIPGTAIAPTPIVFMTVEQRVATQRRRLRH